MHMYGAGGAAAAAAGTGTLAMTGMNTGWYVITGVALIGLGVLVTRLKPKRAKNLA